MDDVQEGAYSSTPLVASLASEGEGVPFDTRVVGFCPCGRKAKRTFGKKPTKKNGLNNELFGSQRVFGVFFVKGADHPTLGVQREN